MAGRTVLHRELRKASDPATLGSRVGRDEAGFFFPERIEVASRLHRQRLLGDRSGPLGEAMSLVVRHALTLKFSSALPLRVMMAYVERLRTRECKRPPIADSEQGAPTGFLASFEKNAAELQRDL